MDRGGGGEERGREGTALSSHGPEAEERGVWVWVWVRCVCVCATDDVVAMCDVKHC